MSGEERRNQIVAILSNTKKPISGTALAQRLSVSRQVIVQDIALLRANGILVFSGNRGYMLQKEDKFSQKSRVFKVIHSDEEVEEELNLIVDLGGQIKDVFVYHKVYDVLRAEMNLKSRRDVQKYMLEISSGKSSLLKNVTSGYHYHTVLAEDEETLDEIQQALAQKGFLAKLQDYEPVDFWKKE